MGILVNIVDFYDSNHPAIIKGVEFRFPEGTTLTEIRGSHGFGEGRLILNKQGQESKFKYEITPRDCVFDRLNSNKDYDDVRLEIWLVFLKEYKDMENS